MSNPLVHAERSARQWGGEAADYLPIHQWFDATKGHLADARHRMVLHNAFGLLLAEQVFGPAITHSGGRRVFVRDIAAQHILEDLVCCNLRRIEYLGSQPRGGPASPSRGRRRQIVRPSAIPRPQPSQIVAGLVDQARTAARAGNPKETRARIRKAGTPPS